MCLYIKHTSRASKLILRLLWTFTLPLIMRCRIKIFIIIISIII